MILRNYSKDELLLCEVINLDLSEKTESSFRHPWELSRTEIILRELKKLNISGNVLDIGCGDAYFDDMLLKRFPRIKELWELTSVRKKILGMERLIM